MSRPGVSYEDVSKVATTLLSQGTHPSVQRVRNELGTGSNTTIDRHLKSWQETFKQEKRTVLPETVPEELMSPLDTFWQTAMAHAENNYQKFKEELQEKLEETELTKSNALLQLKEKAQAYVQLESRMKEAQDEITALIASLLHLEGEHKASQEHIESIKSESLRSLKLADSRIEDFQKQVNSLEKKATLQKETEAKRNADFEVRLIDERKRGEDAESRLMVEIDSRCQEIKAKDKMIASLQEELKTILSNAQKMESGLQKQLTENTVSLERVTDELESSRITLSQNKNRENTLLKQLNETTEILQQTQYSLSEVHARELQITQKVTKLETKLATKKYSQGG